jgi:pilus assembly protein CpaB
LIHQSKEGMTVKISPRWIVLGSAAAFGLSAGFGVHYYIDGRVAALESAASHKEFVKQIVANQDLPRGARLNPETVSIRAIPKEWSYPDALTPEQLPRFDNAALDVPARRGQPILWAQLASQGPRALSDRLQPGRRAVAVPVDDISSVAGLVKPGDRIDLLVSIKRNTRTTLMPLVQRALVLATGARTDSRASPDAGSDQRSYNTMTLDVSPEDARRLFAARELGRLTAVLRTPDDEGDSSGLADEASAILGLSRTANRRSGAVVLYADQLAMNPAAGAALRVMP